MQYLPLRASTDEAIVLRHGLLLGAGCNKLIVNLDSLELLNLLNNGPAEAIVDDCYHLACEFLSTSFVHCFRESNVIAHEKAKMEIIEIFS